MLQLKSQRYALRDIEDEALNSIEVGTSSNLHGTVPCFSYTLGCKVNKYHCLIIPFLKIQRHKLAYLDKDVSEEQNLSMFVLEDCCKGLQALVHISLLFIYNIIFSLYIY